jgi:hypothetical protein
VISTGRETAEAGGVRHHRSEIDDAPPAHERSAFVDVTLRPLRLLVGLPSSRMEACDAPP